MQGHNFRSCCMQGHNTSIAVLACCWKKQFHLTRAIIFNLSFSLVSLVQLHMSHSIYIYIAYIHNNHTTHSLAYHQQPRHSTPSPRLPIAPTSCSWATPWAT